MGRKPQEKLKCLNGVKKLSGTEMQFMDIIWTNPEGISSESLYENFSQALGTKTTILHRIVKKGYVEVEQKGRHFWYYPKLTKLEYQQALINQRLKQAFGLNSLETLIASFCGKKKLSDIESNRIEDFLKDLEK